MSVPYLSEGSVAGGEKMGCVTCTPALEGVVSLSEASVRNNLSSMLQPNTITGEPLIVNPEPFINSIYHLLCHNKDRVFLIDSEDDKKYTFADLLQRSECWATWLRSRGFGKGDIVSVSSENNIDSFGVTLGTWLCGAIVNPINYNFTAKDIKVMFECTEPDLIYCSKSLENVEKAVETLEKKAPIVTPGGQYPNIDLDTILKLNVDNFQPFYVENPKDHITNILFTSGTTGIPKGIQITDNTLKIFPRSVILDSTPLMITSPMFWVSNLVGFCFAISKCNTIVIPKIGWHAEDILETIQTYKPSSWFTGPSLLLEMIDKPFLDNYDISSLETVITGGTLLLANQRRDINEKIFKNRLIIKHVYGSTEVGIITKWTDDININSNEYNCVGTLEGGVTLKVMSPEGRQLGPRQEGEVWVKTASMTPGYMTLKREIHKAMDENGWYHMGDLGFYDEKKLLYIVGRLKDILKYRSLQIAPAEIENILNDHPDVLESCVVGKFDVIDGDQPVAFVVLRESSKTSVEDLFQFCRENIAQTKWPKEIIIMEALPKNAVGKPLRGELEKLFK